MSSSIFGNVEDVVKEEQSRRDSTKQGISPLTREQRKEFMEYLAEGDDLADKLLSWFS